MIVLLRDARMKSGISRYGAPFGSYGHTYNALIRNVRGRLIVFGARGTSRTPKSWLEKHFCTVFHGSLQNKMVLKIIRKLL